MTTEERSEYGWWREYDYAAKDCARRGLTGAIGDVLMDGLSGRCCDEINADPEAFRRRVREFAYALARERGHCTCGDGYDPKCAVYPVGPTEGA